MGKARNEVDGQDVMPDEKALLDKGGTIFATAVVFMLATFVLSILATVLAWVAISFYRLVF